MQIKQAAINIRFNSDVRYQVAKIQSEINSDIERGGIFIGSIFDEAGLRITEIFETDGGSKNHFCLNCEKANGRINEVYKESNGEKNLVGIWHTHNRQYAYPTLPDLTAIGLLSELNYNNIYPIQLIIAKENCFLMNLFNL